MSVELFQTIRLSLTPEQFRRLPRHAAFKYEWIAGETWLTPRPRFQHALLDLDTFAPLTDDWPDGIRPRRLEARDWESLPPLFAAAFRTVQPYGSLDDDPRLAAARKILDQTRSGGDGPLLEPACFVAIKGGKAEVCGAILLTLIPLVDLSDPESSARWEGLPPENCVENRLGRPHLTWVFVSPTEASHGIGSDLLGLAVRELLLMGFHDLATTFLVGNDISLLWHWRNGFRLLGHPGSWREMRRRWK